MSDRRAAAEVARLDVETIQTCVCYYGGAQDGLKILRARLFSGPHQQCHCHHRPSPSALGLRNRPRCAGILVRGGSLTKPDPCHLPGRPPPGGVVPPERSLYRGRGQSRAGRGARFGHGYALHGPPLQGSQLRNPDTVSDPSHPRGSLLRRNSWRCPAFANLSTPDPGGIGKRQAGEPGQGPRPGPGFRDQLPPIRRASSRQTRSSRTRPPSFMWSDEGVNGAAATVSGSPRPGPPPRTRLRILRRLRMRPRRSSFPRGLTAIGRVKRKLARAPLSPRTVSPSGISASGRRRPVPRRDRALPRVPWLRFARRRPGAAAGHVLPQRPEPLHEGRHAVHLLQEDAVGLPRGPPGSRDLRSPWMPVPCNLASWA